MRAFAPHHWSYAVFKSRRVRGPVLFLVFALALGFFFFFRVFGFSVCSKTSFSQFQFDQERTNTFKHFLQSFFVFRGYSTHISMCISKICILFCADRQHRQELKATWSRLNRRSGGAMIPGAGPVTRNSVSTHTSVAWRGLKDETDWKRCGVFGYCSPCQWVIIDHVNVITFKSIPFAKIC